ncbi:sugar ABC transporter ATP-binding protein [Halanaerocella petrolearia]
MGILKAENISKFFPGVKALDNVCFEIKEGEVHGLVGENGAGKSTLMKILSGVHEPSEGDIIYNGNKVKFDGVMSAQEKGISIIHQEFNLFDNLTVAENIFIGREPTNGSLIDKKLLKQRTEDLLSEYNLDLDSGVKVKNLTVAYQQMVEIAKALSYDSKILIMDEPTDALTKKEEKILFDIIAKLKAKGITIIYISHRLEEIFEICDRVTVLRDGQKVATKEVDAVNKDDLVSYMVGRELDDFYKWEEHEIGSEIFTVENLSRDGVFDDISFELREGEILGFAGLVGAGRSEVMRSILGVDPMSEGQVYLKGKEIELSGIEDAVDQGVGYLPEDRKREGLVLQMNTRENITLPILKKLSKTMFPSVKEEKELVNSFMEDLDIKATKKQKVKQLSGGNQQKVAISKWLAIEPEILILDEPTRGVDVGAKAKIYSLITKLAKQGMGIIMISSEMPEIIGMSDRILVLSEGELTGEFSRQYFNQEDIMLAASGEQVRKI